MDLNNLFSKKLGPFPMWLVILLGVAGAWGGYRYFKMNKGGNGTGTDEGGIFAPASGEGHFNSTAIGGDGTSASMSVSGPLLSSGGVGYATPGYPGYVPGGDVYVNIPGSPVQQTTQSTSLQTYTVKPGDTLLKITQKFFGERAGNLWRRLYMQNYGQIGDNPNPGNGVGNLKVGDVISIPVITEADVNAAIKQGAEDWTDDKHNRGGSRKRRKRGHHDD